MADTGSHSTSLQQATKPRAGRRQVLVAAAATLTAPWAVAQTVREPPRGYEIQPWPATRPLPRMVATDLDGRSWDLSALRGRAVLLNFWATWCGPCKAEMPTLQDVAEIYGESRLQVLAINYKETAARAQQFVQSSGLTLPILRDPEGILARDWGASVFPTTVLVDTQGRAQQRVRGEVEWTGPEARRWLEALMVPLRS